MALYQDDCDFMTGKILLLLQGEQMNKTATHMRLYDQQTTDHNNIQTVVPDVKYYGVNSQSAAFAQGTEIA